MDKSRLDFQAHPRIGARPPPAELEAAVVRRRFAISPSSDALPGPTMRMTKSSAM
jgi:hypothetical protein